MKCTLLGQSHHEMHLFGGLNPLPKQFLMALGYGVCMHKAMGQPVLLPVRVYSELSSPKGPDLGALSKWPLPMDYWVMGSGFDACGVPRYDFCDLWGANSELIS